LDILIKDALGRSHQCGTIQLDFQLPRRFDLRYVGDDGSEHVPVMIHRAILGSGERMFAVLTEHCAGKWSSWLNPRQVAVIPVANSHRKYAASVQDELFAAGIRSFVIDDGNTLQKRIRNAQVSQYNYMIVLGDEEEKAGTVSIRNRDKVGEIQQMERERFAKMVAEENKF
jgi:threonyl-tRNA synthetase